MRGWSHSRAGKWSQELRDFLAYFGYVEIDPKTGQAYVKLTALQKTESIQSVARALSRSHPYAAPILLGELRQQLRLNGIKDLEDRADTAAEWERTTEFKTFGRKANT